jgi:twinkle protein
MIKLLDGEVRALEKRGINADTCDHYGYTRGVYNGEPVHIAPYYNEANELVAQHLRTAGKDFPWVGDSRGDIMPFGWHAFRKEGRMLVLTEGEIDAMSVSQCYGNKYPVWSIPTGAGPQTRKYIAKIRDHLLRFDRVVICFDNDKPGQDAARVAAEVIGPTANITALPLKDANEMLLAGRVEELIKSLYDAQPHSPEGIVSLDSLETEVFKGVEMGMPWPWPSLTAASYGRRYGELYTLGAGTGIGKTEVFLEIVEHTIRELHLPVGCFFLEQQPRETALRLTGKVGGKAFHVPDGGWTEGELAQAWSKLKTSAAPVYLYDSFGVNTWEAIENRIRFLRHAHDVRHFFVDNLTALAAAEDDERKALEVIMSKIGGLVKELDCIIYLISHLATPDGTPHEEGGRVMIRHFKGSRSIGFWSHYMFALERDQQAEDAWVRATTTFRILKDRYTGRANGQTFYLTMDASTNHLVECAAPEEGKKYGFTSDTTNGDF